MRQHQQKNLVYEKIAPSKNAVDHPSHYTQGKFEVIDVIEDWELDFHLGNVVKYLARAPHKGELLQDLLKAQWYLQRKIQLVQDLQ